MPFSLTQRFLITLIQVGIFSLWFFDFLRGLSVKSWSVVFGRLAVVSISVFFFVFLGYNSQNHYLATVADGFVAEAYNININSEMSAPKAHSNVLGVKTVAREFPVKTQDTPVPDISAVSAYVLDVKNNQALFEKNIDKRLAPASTTKLMTALVALDIYSPDDKLVIKKECTEIDSTKDWLPEGATFSVKDLLYSALVSSAGDSACTLAVGGIPYNEFVYQMNRRAKLLGMSNTYFTNPVGLDGIAHSHYSSARDLATLAIQALNNPLLASIVKTKEYVVKSVGEDHIFNIHNTNKMLWDFPQSAGVKTGTTEEAGEVLIYAYKDNVKDLLIVVMGSDDRFSDTRALLSWVLSSYSWD